MEQLLDGSRCVGDVYADMYLLETNQKANEGRSPAQGTRHRPLLDWTIPAFKTHCWKWEMGLCIL